MLSNFSIKWRLTISFVLLGLTLVGLYVAMATETFESDKISYIFDSEQAQVDNFSKQIDLRIDQAIFSSRSVVAAFDFSSKKLNMLGQGLFNEQHDIIGIRIIDASNEEILLNLAKDETPFPELKDKKNDQEIISLGTNKFVITLSEKNANNDQFNIHILVSFKDLIPKSAGSIFVFSQGNKVLNETKNEAINKLAEDVIQDLSLERSSKTLLKTLNHEKYLISSAPLRYGNLRITSIVDEKTALGALKILFSRSLVFVLFSTFATIIISLLLSSGLTSSLQQLTVVAEKISQGDFSSDVKSNSNDEVGVLSKAFSKMNQEIQRLLTETKDKARMESELKTAKLVQQNLFPKIPNFKKSNVDLNGLLVTSTECGGDWWYYFERENKLFIMIADATGHGTPAALITSAARALFSQFERMNSTIEEMAHSWDLCVADCSNQDVLMTGLLLELDQTTGVLKLINASHELPLLVSRTSEENDFKCEPLILPVGPRLGEKKALSWISKEIILKPDDKLVIYTDGLPGIINSKGKELGEKRMIKAIEKISINSEGAFDFTHKIYEIFEKHREGIPLPDDVTLVILEWQATASKKGSLVA